MVDYLLATWHEHLLSECANLELHDICDTGQDG